MGGQSATCSLGTLVRRRANSYVVAVGIASIDVSTPTIPDAVALIDEADLELVLDGQGGWLAWRGPESRTVYVVRKRRGTRKTEYLHRVVLGLAAGDSREADHRSGNGLDNRRSELRIATRLQNSQNIAGRRGARSRYKGVSWSARQEKWQVGIKATDGRRVWLGLFVSEEDAARAYDSAAIEHHGEFAKVNFQVTTECLS